MSTIIPTSASAALPAKTAATPTSNDVGASAAKVGNEPERQASVTVTLSEYAQKRAKSMRNAFGKLREMQARQDESRKDAARQRLEDIKKRIEMLKQLVMALGPAGAKGALRQLKQLAQGLGQVASVLKEPSGGGTSSVGVAQAPTAQGESGVAGAAVQEVATVDAVGEAASVAASVAAVEVEAPEMDAEAAELATGEETEQGDEPEASEEQGEQRTQDALGQARHERNARQRRADAEALKKVAAQLKQLLAMVRSQVSGKPDEESKKLIDGIDKQLAEVEKAAGEMAGGGLSLSVAVGVTLSINV